MSSIMRKSAIMLGLFLAVYFMPLTAVAQYYNSPDVDRPLISVTGEAEVRVTPDIVIIILNVETTDSNLAKAKSMNDDIIEKINKISKKYNLDKKALQMDRYSFDPRYNDYRKREFIGYGVSKTVVITLNDVSIFEDIMTDLIDAGADQLINVDFRTSELRKYKDQARALAIKAAKEKAVDMAGELDQTIGKAFNISESRSYTYSWYGYGYGSRRGSMSPFNTQVSVESQPAYTGNQPIGLGEIGITAKINVSFDLE